MVTIKIFQCIVAMIYWSDAGISILLTVLKLCMYDLSGHAIHILLYWSVYITCFKKEIWLTRSECLELTLNDSFSFATGREVGIETAACKFEN